MRLPTLRTTAAALIVSFLSCPSAPAQPPSGQDRGPVVIGGHPYEKLATREDTQKRMIQLLKPEAAIWGTWYQLSPFDWKREGPRLATPGPIEAELGTMKPGGPGPDLQAEHPGKNGTKATWRPVGDILNHSIQLGIHLDQDLNELACSYLYGTVETDKPTTIEVTMGSDDGLRFWLNGRLLVDADVERGLDPEAHRVKLDLQPGRNHLLAKVGQHKGGYEYQLNTRPALDAMTDAQLQYQLNLDFPATPEDIYYRALTIPVPQDIVLEAGGLDVLPPNAAGECRPVVSTRRGDVYIIEGAYEDPPFGARFKKFATGLHEPLGAAVRVETGKDGTQRAVVYCVQRGELTRLIDTDGDDIADVYETFFDGWGVSGNYHEFAFGPKFDRHGNAWVTLNVGFCGSLGKSIAPWRGWALKIAPDGTMSPVCDGLRSPNGLGMFSDGEMFYWDNQGDYVGTNRMTHLAKGSWAGHPCTLRWRSDWKAGDPDPPLQPAAIWLPYKKMGQSGADFLLYEGSTILDQANAALKAEKFGPFAGQVFVGDQTLCLVSRIDMEKVDGVYQGAAFPFRSGLDCGVNRLAWGGDGSMFVGQTDRGWASIGRLRYGLQRLVWTGKTPFEVRTMRVKPDGFELTFTKDLDERTAADPASYTMLSYTYEYHQAYGSKEMETEPQKVTRAAVLDKRTVRLTIDKLRSGGMGYVHELALPGLKDTEGQPLLHPVAYYTLQKLPSSAGTASR